ncbi:MAG: fibronectin type III domain-containing protein [Deferribacteres bacterium]|nr:fibronectin type III domain-containing protein [Deferribacteres bacterium]
MQKTFIIRLLIAVGFMLVVAGCGGGGSGGGNGSGSTSISSDPADTDTGGGTVTGSGTALSGAAILTWTAPETNADGTPLTDLAGYKIYYGRLSGNYTEVKDVGIPSCEPRGDKTECSYTVEGLSSGTWYFAITAYDTSGNESDYSNEVSKEVTE